MKAAAVDTWYARTRNDHQSYPALQEEITADVCVVGGGLAGLNVALGLVERGKKVVLLEGRSIGYGASGRNGGFVLAGFSSDESKLVERLGLQAAREYFALTSGAQALIRRRISSYNIDCDVVDGYATASVIDDKGELREYSAFLQKAFGLETEYWTKERLQDVCRTEAYHDALYYPDYFSIHPLNYALGLARAVAQKGGHIFEGSLVLRVRETDSGIIAATDKGLVQADHIVYCGSAYFNDLDKKLARAHVPVTSYVMVTDPIDKEKMRSAITRPIAVIDDKWACDYYRTLPDSSILWGGRVGLGRDVAPPHLADKMIADMVRIYPQLTGVRARMVWAGTMASTIHRGPHVQQMRPGVWCCTDFGNNGIGPSAAAGEAIAAAIAGNDEMYKIFEPFRIGYSGGILGVLAAQAIYRSWQWRGKWHSMSMRRKQLRAKL